MTTRYPVYRDYKTSSDWVFGAQDIGHKQVYTEDVMWIPNSWGQGGADAVAFREAYIQNMPVYDRDTFYCTFNPTNGAYNTGFNSRSFTGITLFPITGARFFYPISPKVLTAGGRDYYFTILFAASSYCSVAFISVPEGTVVGEYIDKREVSVNELYNAQLIRSDYALIEYNPSTVSTVLLSAVRNIYIAGGNTGTAGSLNIGENSTYLTIIYDTVQGYAFGQVIMPSGTLILGDTDRDEGYTPPEPPEPTDDPYETGAGGASSTGGGTGTFSETGDTVGIPSLPTLSAVDTGFITLFNPTASQVKQLASYMWSAGFDLDTFKNVVANPMDCILGLTIVPVNPPNAGSKAVTVGNIATDVVLPYLSSQYVAVDCGTLNVQEFWGSYLDYSPYTKMSLYLPYIGIVPLDIDDVMNASISVTYHVDVLSGACVAYVLCNGTQLYTYIGQCSSNVPVTSNDFTNTVNGILGIAGNIGSLVSTGGASAPSQLGAMASNVINTLKPNIQKSGAMSGTGGLMGVQTPYLICQRPRQSIPHAQNSFTGYPSNITATLNELSGYTEIEKIHLEGVPCTNEEMEEIMHLLESGVYI